MSCNIRDITTDEDLARGLVQLDQYIESRIAKNTSSLHYVSLINLLNFDKQVDLYDCNSIYWFDGDHWSASGERRFGKKIVDAIPSLN
jgi:hypothetical protein